MSMNVLAPPVASAASWEEEVALLFAKSSEEEARGRVARQVATARATAAEAALATAEAALSAANARIQAATTATQRAEAMVITDTTAETQRAIEAAQGQLKTVRVVAGVAGLILGIAVGGGGLGVALALAGAIVAHVIFAKKLNGEAIPAHQAAIAARDASTAAKAAAVEAAAREASSAADARRTAEGSRGAASSELAAARAVVAKPIPEGADAIVRGYVPFRVQEMAGYRVIVDTVGLVDEVDYALPDLVHDLDALQSIRSRVERFEHTPALLRAEGTARNELDAVYGEEEELRDTMQDWVATMGEIPILRGALRMVPGDSPIAAALSSGTHRADATPGAIWVNPTYETRAKALTAELDACFAKARAVGGDGERALTETYERLRAVVESYGERRREALQTFCSNVHSVLSRSSLLSVHCYCPRCNRVPEYMYMKLGVPFEQTHMVDQDALLERLMADPEIVARMTAQPTLRTDLEGAFRALGSLAEEEASLRTRVENMPKALAEQRLRAFQSQQNAVLSEYRSVLRHIVVGNPRPAVELGRASRLHLDPDTFAWTCAACHTTWTDLDIVGMGRVLRVKDDLLMPMWNHLWTEKDDFRKSEIFRTNEQLATFSEKEGEKLLGIAESYKSDLRGVRERIIDATATAENAREKLYSTLDGLVDMELMTRDRADGVRTRLESEGGESSKVIKRKAEANEMLLLAEPQAQLRRRTTAVDPIRMFSEPSALFKHVPPLLAAPPVTALPEPAPASEPAIPARSIAVEG